MVFFHLLEPSRDIELNPGPKPDSSQCFLICHGNLNSILAHSYSKISLLTTQDINDVNLKIPGWIMYCVDHPSDVKRGRFCIYYWTMLPLKVLSTNFLLKYTNFEVSIGNRICRFIRLYKTPSQSQDEFHDFLRNFEMNLDSPFNRNPFLTTVIGDFNAKSNKRKARGCNQLIDLTSELFLHISVAPFTQ